MRRGLALTLLLAMVVLAMAFAGTNGPPSTRAETSEPRAANPAVRQPCLVGVGGCSAIACHGAAFDGDPQWQSAFTVWATQDKHSQAFSVLFGDAAKQISRNLSQGDPKHPPHQDQRCIGCHSVASLAPDESPNLADGVGCEACHGAAENWVTAHTAKDWKPSHGMVDTKNVAVRAQQCVKCHVGDYPREDGATRDVNHDLIAAGHPRLAFELTSYLEAMPPHWALRPQEDPLIVWAIGRAVALDATINLLEYRTGVSKPSVPTSSAKLVWPEFAEFDCYSCHRLRLPSLDDKSSNVHLGQPRRSTWYSALAGISEPLLGSKQPIRLDPFDGLMTAPSADHDGTRTALASLIDQAKSASATGSSVKMLAASIRKQTDKTNWDQVAQAYLAFKALAAHAGKTIDRDAFGSQIVKLRSALEFPVARDPLTGETEIEGDVLVHFDSPRNFIPSAQVDQLLCELVKIFDPSVSCEDNNQSNQ